MASARLNRQSCEIGRLPPICICCGARATQRVRHRFYAESTARIIGVPILLFLTFSFGAIGWLVARRLFLPDSVEFLVPVCDRHRFRLRWHRYFLAGVVVLLVVAAAVLLPLSISILTAHGDDVSGKIQLMEGALLTALALLIVLPVTSMAIKLTMPRVFECTSMSIDMTCLSPEFVEALQTTSTSLIGGYGQAVGKPLISQSKRAGARVTAIAMGALLSAVCGFCLLGYAATRLTGWQHRKQTANFFEQSRIRRQQMAELQRRAAQSRAAPPPTIQGKTSTSIAPTNQPLQPSTTPQIPLGRFSVPPGIPEYGSPFDVPGVVPSDAAPQTPVLPLALPVADAGPRLEEFRPMGNERFPPKSREVLNATQLKAGMQVWARDGLTWRRSTIARIDSQMTAHVRFAAGGSERMLPTALIRIPED